MVYFKSLFAGLIAVIVASILSPFVMALYLYLFRRPSLSETIGWDPISFGRQPFSWLLGTLIFLLGFLWEFRRAH
jgi:hypothetical protein